MGDICDSFSLPLGQTLSRLVSEDRVSVKAAWKVRYESLTSFCEVLEMQIGRI